MHVAILGASGKIGRIVVQNLFASNAVPFDLTLLARRTERLEGLMMDVRPAAFWAAQEPAPVSVRLSADPSALEGADLVLFLAGRFASPEEDAAFRAVDKTGRFVQSYLNHDLVVAMGQALAAYAPRALVVMVSNQADMMAHLLRESFPPASVLGFGGMLDRARFRQCAADAGAPQEGAHMVGFHTNAMRPLRSTLTLAPDLCERVLQRTRAYGRSVFELQKDASFPGLDTGPSILPGLALARIVRTFLGQAEAFEASFNVSLGKAVAAHYGVSEGSALSVPVRVRKGGYDPLTDYAVSAEEKAYLKDAQADMDDACRTMAARFSGA
ncbi:MAG: hypothetical protein PHS57_04410 [Alphaproteobacteria bacterium]|nr:hypothetical protein [Alphaproteobacteria bacterium]